MVACDEKPNKGPIPEGMWQVSAGETHTFRMKDGSTDKATALALTPTNPDQALGRNGFLAHHSHSPNLQSRGCISLVESDMQKLLQARQAGVFTNLLVTGDAARLAQPHTPKVSIAAAGKPLKTMTMALIP